MHIVHIMASNSSVPYFNWFAEEIKNYPQFKFSFIALYPTSPQMMEDMRLRGCDCYWIKFDSAKRKSSMISVLPKLVGLLKKIKADVVNTHLFDDSLPGLLAARLAGIKKRVITKGDTTYHWNYAPTWVWADRFNNFNATDVVAISNESKEFILTKEKANSRKVSMIHHGIPFKYLTDQRDDYKKELTDKYLLAGKIVIGTVARLIEWKGYRYIIEAARKVVKTNPNIVFLFAGLGDQYEELVKLVNNYGLNKNIIFTGWVARNYIPSLYSVMDIYLHAATTEPFGFVIAEAMANGTPLVTTKTGAAADALEHKKNCYFVEEKNADEIADGISWMLEDLQRKEKIASEGIELAHKMYDVKYMLKNYLSLYKANNKW